MGVKEEIAAARSTTIGEATQLFDDLTQETWFGLNMRMVITTSATKEELAAVRSFIEKCRLGRCGLSTKKVPTVKEL